MKKLLTLAAVLATTLVFGQGLTSSSVGGRVLDDQGVPLLGTTVIIKHEPTGSVYGATTDKNGFYRLSGLRPGGPYTIDISYVGFESYTNTGMYLQLGVSEQINTTLSSSANVLDEVVVSAGGSSNKNGT